MAANRHDVTQDHALLHDEETNVFADSCYRDVEKREEIQVEHLNVTWHAAMMPGKRKVVDKSTPTGAVLEQLENTKASTWAKVDQPFRRVWCRRQVQVVERALAIVLGEQPVVASQKIPVTKIE